MTYRQLLEKLKSMTEEELDLNVTVWDANQVEFYPVDTLDKATVTDVLDEGHPYLTF